jgi:hypothetical protein
MGDRMGNVDYMEVMGVVGSVAAKHPQTTALGMQTKSLWEENRERLTNAYNKFNSTKTPESGMLDHIGILMQIAANDPRITQNLIRILSMWQGRIPDLIQILTEFQASSEAAMKS